jgi:hypothetical protein
VVQAVDTGQAPEITSVAIEVGGGSGTHDLLADGVYTRWYFGGAPPIIS